MSEQVSSPSSEQAASPKTVSASNAAESSSSQPSKVQRYATEADVLALMTNDKFKKFCKKKCGECAPASRIPKRHRRVIRAGAAASPSSASPRCRRSSCGRESEASGAKNAAVCSARRIATSTAARWKWRSWRGGDASTSTRFEKASSGRRRRRSSGPPTPTRSSGPRPGPRRRATACGRTGGDTSSGVRRPF